MVEFEKLKDPLIVSALFFIVASDWFDNWLRDTFPTLRSGNPMMFTLIKTGIFAVLYWMYNSFMKKKDDKTTTTASTTNTPAASGSNGKKD